MLVHARHPCQWPSTRPAAPRSLGVCRRRLPAERDGGRPAASLSPGASARRALLLVVLTVAQKRGVEAKECRGGKLAVCKCVLGCDVFGGQASLCDQTTVPEHQDRDDALSELMDQVIYEETVRNPLNQCDAMECVVSCSKKLHCLDTAVKDRCTGVNQNIEDCNVECEETTTTSTHTKTTTTTTRTNTTTSTRTTTTSTTVTSTTTTTLESELSSWLRKCGLASLAKWTGTSPGWAGPAAAAGLLALVLVCGVLTSLGRSPTKADVNPMHVPLPQEDDPAAHMGSSPQHLNERGQA